MSAYYKAQLNPTQPIAKESYRLSRLNSPDIRPDYDAALLSNIRRYILKNNKLTQHELNKLQTEVQNQLQSETLHDPTLHSKEPENNFQVNQPDIVNAIPTQCENNIDQQEKMGISARLSKIDKSQFPSQWRAERGAGRDSQPRVPG